VRTWNINGPDEDVFTRAEVVTYLRLPSEQALDRLIKAGKFPPGISTGGKRSPPIWTGLDIAAFLHLQGRAGLEGVEGDDDEDAEK
jgi:hypothetical protein